MRYDFHQRHFFHRTKEVQTDYLLRSRGTCGDIANRQRRRIRGKNGVRRAVLFYVGDHLLFQRQIFKYGFNHQVTMVKTAVVGGA
ncbi:hypothetical protein D3C81_1641720 [compost metagenome]